jgi:hypothetical protein
LQNLRESVDLAIIDNVPEFYAIATCEHKFIDVSRWMHHDVEVTVELLPSNYDSSSDVENNEFAILSE